MYQKLEKNSKQKQIGIKNKLKYDIRTNFRKIQTRRHQ